MTGRLKRKLNDLGVDIGSSKAAENFCLIGTPLPPLEKSKDTGEFVPLWKQEVRDEKGRRRLHGAFTGGFSAGYFNSVGSKEGWTPSEFKSSRADRAKKKELRPEDFMDEEDLTELRDSQKLVDTTEEMDVDAWERTRIDGDGQEKDSIANALANALLPGPSDSVGAKILKRMGWRIGHGIGPKVTYEQRKRQDAMSHASAGSGEDLQDVEEHEEAKKHLYPPRDTKVPVFKRKDDRHGLGYGPGMGLSALVAGGTVANDGSSSRKGPNISAGFGLGALNDADEDDLDVYDPGSTQLNRRLAYDADEDDDCAMAGSLPKAMRSSRISNAQPVITGKTTFQNSSQCVPGFVVAEKPVTEENLYPPPVVPKGWKPDPHRVWAQDKENFKAGHDVQEGQKQSLAKGDQGRRRTSMTADQRGTALGETPLHAAPRSVFDYLNPKDRDRLQSLAAGLAPSAAPATKVSEPSPGPPISEQEVDVPRIDPQVAKMALQGFQPFTNDPEKQARYTAYLKVQATGDDSVPFSRAPGQAADSFLRELQDYARSAQIFKPVSGAMAGRFTRAAVLDTGANSMEGLHRPEEQGSYLSTPGENMEENQEEKEESPKENAARLGMFGPLTREVKPWSPARLLCKRFGVKELTVELPEETTATATPSGAGSWQNGGALTITDGTESGTTRIGDPGETSQDIYSAKSGTNGKRNIANIGLGDEDESQGRDILTYERPGMDIFKAIFASDDEDEGGEDDNADEDNDDSQRGPHGKNRDIGVGGGAEIAEGSSAAGISPPPPIDYNNAAGKVDMTTGKVDMTTFKPTFVPRSDRAKEKDRAKQDKDKDRERKKKKRKTLVSFELDDESGSVERERERDGDRGIEKRRKKKTEKKDVQDDDSVWIEKPPPEALQNGSTPTASVSNTSDITIGKVEVEAGPQRGRKRAIDFM